MGQVASVLGAIVGVRLLTGLLPPEPYGRLALGMTVVTLVSQVLFGPLSKGAMRFFSPAREAGALASYLHAVRSLVLQTAGVAVLMALALCAVLLGTGHSDWILLSLTAMCFALLSGCNSLLNGMQNAARQRAIVALHQGLASWTRFLLAAALVKWLGPKSTLAVLGYTLAILVVLLSQTWFFRRTLPAAEGPVSMGQPDVGRWRAGMVGYAWPFAIWGILTWGQFASGRWALQAFASTEDVGLYAALYQIGFYPMTISVSLATQLLAPIYFQRAGDGCDPSRVQRVCALNQRLVWAGLGLTATATLIGTLWHDTLFALLLAPEYGSMATLLPWMILAGGLFATGQVASLSLMSSMKSNRLLAPKVGTAVIGISASYLGAAFFGSTGVVGAGVMSWAVYLLWILAVNARYSRQPKP